MFAIKSIVQMSRFLKNATGFTLLEVLVSISVLSFVLIIFSTILDRSYQTAEYNRKRLFADEEARLVLDRIGTDLKAMLNRPDVDFYFLKNSGNDELYFFANAPSYYEDAGNQQTVSLIGYRVKENRLERLGYGLSWDGAPPVGMVYLTKNGTSIIAESTLRVAYGTILGGDENFQTIGYGIFRFEVHFLLKPVAGGNTIFSESPFLAGGSSPFSNSGSGLNDLAGILVTIALIDQESRNILSESDLTQLANKFSDNISESSDDSSSELLPFSDWDQVASRADELNIPIKAASHVRVYRRLYSIGHSL